MNIKVTTSLLAGLILGANMAHANADEAMARCNAKPAQFVIGQTFSTSLAEQARLESGANRVVVDYHLQDYRTDRLQIYTHDHIILSVKCG